MERLIFTPSGLTLRLIGEIKEPTNSPNIAASEIDATRDLDKGIRRVYQQYGPHLQEFFRDVCNELIKTHEAEEETDPLTSSHFSE